MERERTDMERLLAPERFDVDPDSSAASMEWEHWYRKFLNFAMNRSDSDKLKLLFNFISSKVYQHVSAAGTFNDAVSILKNLYIKPPNEVFNRHKLAVRSQQTEESVDQFYQALMLLAKDCEFKAVTAEKHRDDFVRDAFIRGLSVSQIRQRLLEEPILCLKDAYEKARSLELAQRQALSFNQPISLNAVSKHEEPVICQDSETIIAAVPGKCGYCGFNTHIRSRCPARNVICNSCGKKGHYSKVCKSSKSQPISKESAAVIIATNYCNSLTSSLNKAIILVEVNGERVQALIDTGSSVTLINELTAKKLKLHINPSREPVSMASTVLQSITSGQCLANIKIGTHTYNNITLSVLPALCVDVIIGHNVLRHHSSVEVSFGGSEPCLKICSLATVCVEPVTLFKNLTPNCEPIAIKSRRQTNDDSKFIKEEIGKLLQENVIERSDSPWRAQVLVTSTANHKRRMVIDYSQTINKFTLLDAYPVPNIEDIVNKVAEYEVFSTIDMRSAYHQFQIKETDKPYTAFEACGELFQFRRIPFGVTNGVAAFQRAINQIISGENLKDTFAYLDDVTICGKNQTEHDNNLRHFMEVVSKYNLTLNKEKSLFSLKSIRLLGYLISNKTIKPDPDRIKPLLNLHPPNNSANMKRVIGMFAHFSNYIPQFSQKIVILSRSGFPLTKEALQKFEELKTDVQKASLAPINNEGFFTVETDASNDAIGATLSQSERPVAFFSRSLSESERRHSSVEKEAYAIVEATRKWRHHLMGRHFRLITDQRSVAFMFNLKSTSKIKNEKILRWRIELSCFSYDIVYRPGADNAAADAFSRICSSVTPNDTILKNLHESLCHPGITRFHHWIRSKNLPFSLDEVKKMTLSCPVCCEIKPRFFKHEGKLIKATSALERLNIDFKGPLPSTSNNKYLLTVVDEYSRYPFAIPCTDMTANTIIESLKAIFTLFGLPSYVHSDRGTSFLSSEVKDFLNKNGIATSRTTAYNPRGNGQVERYNGIVWRNIQLALRSKNKPLTQWEKVIPEALNSIRALLCTTTNETPHERMFRHPRRSGYGKSAPSWLLQPGPVYLRNFVRRSKYDPLVTEVELLDGNTEYAHVKLPDGRETSVSTRHLAPAGNNGNRNEDVEITNDEPDEYVEIYKPEQSTNPEISGPTNLGSEPTNDSIASRPSIVKSDDDVISQTEISPKKENIKENIIVRNSSRIRKPPKFLQDYVRE